MKRVLLYGSAGGVLIALLKYFEYKHFLHAYPSEVYGGLLAVIFSALGIYFGSRLFGVKSYRDNVAGGAVGFGKAFQVGLCITLITCAVYVIAWEIAYFNFFPDFLDKYTAHVLSKMRADGESAAAISKQAETLANMAKYYDNILFNSAITFMEVFPVGLIVTLVSAAILRRNPPEGAPESAVPA